MSDRVDQVLDLQLGGLNALTSGRSEIREYLETKVKSQNVSRQEHRRTCAKQIHR